MDSRKVCFTKLVEIFIDVLKGKITADECAMHLTVIVAVSYLIQRAFFDPSSNVLNETLQSQT